MRAFIVGSALAACAVVQMGAQVRAADGGGAPAMYTKAPVLNGGDPANNAPAPGQGLGGAVMPIPQPPATGPYGTVMTVPQPASTAPYGDLTVTGTGLAVTNGFATRYVADVAGNWYYSGLGLHFDTSRDWREETANYVVGGISYAITPYIVPKFLYGTSSENMGIQPKTYFRGEVAFTTPPVTGSTGIVATPSVSFREYRNGVQETVPEIDVALYHPEFADKTYFVTEVKATTIMVESVSALGYEFSASETYVVPKWGTVGAEFFSGRMVYDVTLCSILCSVENRFVGVRPLVSFYLNHNEAHELFIRGEVVATDFYNIYGATVGLKTKF
jgi:hypothetical protein